MNVTLFEPLYVITNNLCPNDFKHATFNDTNWRLHNNGKLFFNLYEFLERIGRLDVLEKHFDRFSPDLEVTNINYMVMNGKRPSSYYGQRRATKLDEEMDFIMKDPANVALWNDIKEKRIDWRKQKLYTFTKVEKFESIG